MTKKNHFNFSPDDIGSLSDSLNKEWLETNGLGGFSSSTIYRCPTRKYHGLFIHPLKDHQGRFLLVSGLEPELVQGDKITPLGTNIYGDVIHPEGFEHLLNFNPFPHPQWTWADETFSIQEEYLMPLHQEYILIKYKLSENSDPLKLKLKPYLSYRDSHSLTVENKAMSLKTSSGKHDFSFEIYEDLPPVSFHFSKRDHFDYHPYWDKNVTLKKEAERGFDDQEDRFVPGIFHLNLKPGKDTFIAVGLNLAESMPLKEIWDKECLRREKLLDGKSDLPEKMQILVQKSEDFLVKNELGEDSIIAGYPWFGEWGRDTMIALPGLTLSTGKIDKAISILTAYAGYIKNGLLPNTLGGLQGFASYNSLDASLLYLSAVQSAHPHFSGEQQRDFHGYLKAIINAFLENRVPHTILEDDGLLSAGSPETQLTWMDATAYGKPVTPRYGKAVDINALWYNGLIYFTELEKILGQKTDPVILALIEIIPTSYKKTFWMEEGYLADCVTPNGKDGSLRPNMLFPLALPHSPLDQYQKEAVLKSVEEELLTPMGLRTLSPKDSRFCPFYRGNSDQRDATYHQGTVWPWPLELYFLGSVRTYPNDKELKEKLKGYILELLDDHLLNNGLGSISEIFDGLAPDDGKGCFAQAWSVAALIRGWEFLCK